MLASSLRRSAAPASRSVQLQVLQRQAFNALSPRNALFTTRGLALRALRPIHLSRAPADAGGQRRLQSAWGWLRFGDGAPRGFGKFFPKEGKGGAKSGNEKAAAGGKKLAGGGGGGDGGGGGPGENVNPQAVLTGAALVVLLAIQYFSNRENPGREINWQEFKTQLLGAGEVERLLVVNKNLVRVFVRTPGGALASVEVPTSGAGASSGGGGGWNNSGGGGDGPDRWGSGAGGAAGGGGASAGGYAARLEGPAISRHSPFFFSIGSVDSFERKLEIAQRELGIKPSDFVPVQYVAETNWMSEGMKFAPTLLLIGAWIFMMKGMSGGGGMGGGGGGMGKMFKIGKSPANMVKNGETVGVTFKDVAGCDEAKAEIMEFVEFLKNPAKFEKVGAKLPKGALLCGPPGTGKTLLAKATAGEASVPFFSISGSDFIEMFVGVGPSRVRDLFKDARKNAPCIVFIDEIDAVARARGKGGFSGGNDERENTLNQLLVEMDGFATKEGVVVLAGTNRLDILDQAILRPGRFDRQIKVDLPDIKGRKEIFEVHLRELNVEGSSVEVAQDMAALTPGFSGAQIANICNEAAILAARESADSISHKCFQMACDRVIGGLEKRNMVMTVQERRTVAYHEAGHAIAGWFLEHADPLLKVTIIPRMSGALGFAQYLPKELALHTKTQISDRMCMALGGRAAEQLTFESITTGASDDLDKVTKMAYSMVTRFGMNERIGNISFPEGDGSSLVTTKPYSEDTARVIDEEVKIIVDEAYARTLALLTERKEQVGLVAEYLLEHENITQKEIVELIGKRPFDMPQTYADFVGASYGNVAAVEEAEATEAGSTDDDEAPSVDGSGTPPLGFATKAPTL